MMIQKKGERYQQFLERISSEPETRNLDLEKAYSSSLEEAGKSAIQRYLNEIRVHIR